jgi:hypothetical protein
MATATFIPVEVYLRSSYEPDAEYVDGEIEERPMGEHDHAAWQAAIQRLFFAHEQEWNIEVLPEYIVLTLCCECRVTSCLFAFSNCEIKCQRPHSGTFTVDHVAHRMRVIKC